MNNLYANPVEITKKDICNFNEEYPIRKTPNMNGKLCQNDVDEIMYLLQYTYLFNGEIARRYNVKPGTIHYINIGKYHRKEGIEYPIRLWKSSGVKPPVTYDQVTEIIDLIQNTTLSLRKIAGKYGIDVKVVQHIKNGTAKYRRRGLQYPLRPR